MTKSKKTVDYAGCASALSLLSAKIHKGKRIQRAEREAERQVKIKGKRDEILMHLHAGTVKAKSSQWGPRHALAQATQAVKYGATAEELQACKALQEVAEWAELVEPVTLFAKSMLADHEVLLVGLRCVEPEPETEPEPEPKKASRVRPVRNKRKAR